MRVEEIFVEHNTQEWLEEHKYGISGSEAAAAAGLSPFKTNIELWEEKVGIRRPEDISEKPAVKYGVETEGLLFELFAKDYPHLICTQNKHVLYRRGFMLASLDGELEDTRTGEYGFYEGKTTQLRSRDDLCRWNGHVPYYYFAQIMHYFAVTEYDFAILKAQIKLPKTDDVFEIITRHYRFDRARYTRQIQNLRLAEEYFWSYVQSRIRPPLKRRSTLG